MPRYRVIIHGRNFRLNLEGKWEKVGFYTPRFADAPDPLLAEHTALEDFRQSTKFQELAEATLNSDDDPPVLCGEDTEEIVQAPRLRKPQAWLCIGSRQRRGPNPTLHRMAALPSRLVIRESGRGRRR
jgi:hypothetical protein